MKIYDAIVIGAGASGLACAVSSARRGFSTLVLEKGEKAGRKILVSGNGRCNITNFFLSPDKYYCEEKFITDILNSFNFKKMNEFLRSLGILIKSSDESGRYFPVTDKASSVLNSLLLTLSEAGGQINYGVNITEVKKEETFELISESGEKFYSRNLVMACGSPAYTQLGYNSRSYALASMLGHTHTQLYPALSAMLLKGSNLKYLDGIKLDAEIALLDGDTQLSSQRGEIIFSQTGASGLPVLSLSRIVAATPKKLKLKVNLMPSMNKKALQEFLKERIQAAPERKLEDLFEGFLTGWAAMAVLEYALVSKNVVSGAMSDNTFEKITDALQDMRFDVLGVKGFTEANSCAGGVETEEVTSLTLQSKKVKNLFITGEMLNADGICGGYNMHFAFATGVLAGLSIGEV
ncbi:hypothetical protein Dip518_000126 [Parelusimicrobium proximum]|uniref:NAD(P)/FAD-dependent oxidoreductase n=1 Tax=Parelusimicrobium proximum TaxID=3228953 RepID=UPI003D184EDB